MQTSTLFRILLLLASSVLAIAQETRGMLTGRVSDSTGAVMPGVSLRAVNEATSVASEATTNQEGIYVIPFLLPGRYEITATRSGFKTVVRSGIEIRADDRIELNLTMSVGTVGERIEVTGETPLLDTVSASVGQVIDQRRVAELPLMHGNPMAIMDLMPGLAQGRNVNLGVWGGRAFDYSWTTSYTINGAPPNTSDITLDGIPNSTTYGGSKSGGFQTTSYNPPADLVQEFKLQGASFDASTGYNSGATNNISVKSGTNELHGTAMFMKILPNLNANSFFANKAGQPRMAMKYNHWTATATGPVDIPKLYSGKSRTFFSWGYEGQHDVVPWATTASVPIPQNLQGDFSNLLKLGSEYQIYDPFTARLLPDGRIQRAPLPNNILAPSRITQTAKLITSYYPAPRVPGNADGSNNYPDPNQPDPNNYYSHTARIDHSISSANRMYGRFTFSKNLEKGAENLTRNIASGWDIIRRNKSLALDDVHVFSPNVVLNLRLGVNRFHEDNVPLSTGIDLTTLGFTSALNNAIDPRMRAFPRIVVDAYDDLGNYNPMYKLTDVRSLLGSLTVLRGSHNMQMGADLQVYRRNYLVAGQASPQLNFFQNYTNGPYNTSGVAPVGQGLASLLLGIANSGVVLVNDTGCTQDISHSIYFQDTWKLSKRLTVTLGLRYEFTGPVTDRYNRTTINYNYSVPSPINDAVRANYAKNPIPERPLSSFQLIGGPQFAGVNGLPRTLYDASRRGFAPRVGLTYGITPKTVLRAGYGIFVVPLGLRGFDITLTGFAATTLFVPTQDNGLTFRVPDFGQAFADGIRRPLGSALGLATNLGDSVVDIAREQPIPYMQRWQFGFQRELPKRVLLDVAYVGNRGTKLRISRNLNALPNQWLSKSTTRDQTTINFLAQTFPNPFYGVLPTTSGIGASSVITRSGLLVPYPQYSALTRSDSQGFSWYHSLQGKVERRFANGFTAQGS